MSRSGRCISVASGLSAITLLVLNQQVTHFFSVPDRGDPVFSMWRMAWVQHQLGADPRHLFDANIFYPLRATLTYSDAMLLPAIAAWPLAWVGMHPVIAYNVVLLASFVASGLAMYRLVRAFDWGDAAAWIAAVAFMLSPFRISHLSHLELQMTMWMPLTLLGLLRVLQSAERKWVAGAAGALAAQWYSSMYYGLFLTLYSAVFAATLGIAWRIRGRRAVLGLAVYLLAGVIVLPLALVYGRSQSARGVREAESVVEFSATPSDYLRPAIRTPTYRQFLPRVIEGERALFPGLAAVALAIVGLWPPLNGIRLAFGLAALIALDGSLGLNGVLYPLLYKAAFPFRSIRVPARFGMLVMLSIEVLAGYGAARTIAFFNSTRVRRACLVLVTAALMVDSWPRHDNLPMWREPPRIYDSLPRSAVLFEFPVHPEPQRFGENLPYMYFSIWHWRPMLNGYSGFNPPYYAAMVDGTRGFPATSALEYLRRAGVTHATVHCRLWESTACAATTKQLDADPRVRLVVRVQWYGAPSSLYELRR